MQASHGDFILAHRAGVAVARHVYGVPIDSTGRHRHRRLAPLRYRVLAGAQIALSGGYSRQGRRHDLDIAGKTAGQSKPAGSPLPLPAPGPVLIVAGSLSAVIARPVDYLCQVGFPLLEPPQDYMKSGDADSLQSWVNAAARLAGAGLLVSISRMPDLPLEGLQATERLAAAAVRLVEGISPAGLVLTGGDTAAAVCAALKCTLIRLEGEVEPGMAWGRLENGDLPGLAVVTRAGSFGGPILVIEPSYLESPRLTAIEDVAAQVTQPEGDLIRPAVMA